MAGAVGAELLERCLHDRVTLAFEAARAAGLPGDFVTTDQFGVTASFTTSPGLALFNRITGIHTDAAEAVAELLARGASRGTPARSLVGRDDSSAPDAWLRALGYVPAGASPRAVRTFATPAATDPVPYPATRGGIEVVEVGSEAERQSFLDVLAAGYSAPTPLQELMRAEHSSPVMRLFLARVDGRDVAAAAMSVHRDVAVLGAATVLPQARGQGLQTRLLHHRIRVAHRDGRAAVVATAAPDSPSLRNLRAAGFEITLRRSWRASEDTRL